MGSTKLAAARSPCVRLVEESLLLPTQDVSLFATTFLLIFAHTFVFIAVAVHLAHPLGAATLADIQALNSKTTTTHDHASYSYFSEVVEATREHAKKLLVIYLAYLASKLATQLVTALAAAATNSGERLTRKAVRERIGGLACRHRGLRRGARVVADGSPGAAPRLHVDQRHRALVRPLPAAPPRPSGVHACTSARSRR